MPAAGATAHPVGGRGASSSSRVVSRLPETTHIAEPGYVWEATPGYANRGGPETPKDLGKRGYVWEEGPSTAVAGGKSSYFLSSNLSSRMDTAPRRTGGAVGTFVARGSVSPHSNAVILSRRPIPSASFGARPARIFRTRRPRFFGGFFPFGFFPGFFYDDCFGIGFDNGYMVTGLDSVTTRAGTDMFRRDTGSILAEIILILPVVSRMIWPEQSDSVPSAAPDTEPSADEATAPPSAAAPTASADSTVLLLKDGTSFGVTDYWLEGGRLHYVTTYGGANAIDLEALDIQRTVDENAKSGVTFALRPPHWQDQEAKPQQ